MARKTPAVRIACSAAFLVLALALVPAALAGKPATGSGGHKGGGSTTGTSYTGTISGPAMVVDQNGNGSPNAGDSITFNVTSTAPYPFVKLSCSQNGTPVVEQTQAFYSGWLFGTTYYLGGYVWTGGAASCTASLYSVSYSGTTEPTEATLSFSVGA